jgi:hypothetical protein
MVNYRDMAGEGVEHVDRVLVRGNGIWMLHAENRCDQPL